MSKPVLEPLLTELYGRPAPAIDLEKLKGDASTRQYYRGRIESAAKVAPPTLIVMQLPEDASRSDEGGAQPELARLPFLEVAELLSQRGLPVPEVYGQDLEHGVLLLEDLGDQTLHLALMEASHERWVDYYAQAVDLLAELHERCTDLPESSVVRRRRFDRPLIDWELEHFREWGLDAPFGPRSAVGQAVLEDAFRQIADAVEAMPMGFVHRDYQSKNLMVAPSGELAIIDFQDALTGPRVYDLVALLCDSYVSLAPEMQRAMVERYAALRRIEPEELWSEFRWVTLHRKLKDAGRFIYIDRVRKNPDFLEWFPQSLRYVGRAIDETPSLRQFGEVLSTAIPGFPDSVEKPDSSME